MKTFPIYLDQHCACGKHIGLSYEYAAQLNPQNGFTGLYVDCKCGSTVYIPDHQQRGRRAKYEAIKRGASS